MKTSFASYDAAYREIMSLKLVSKLIPIKVHGLEEPHTSAVMVV
jgi:hypothetical protein